MVDAGAAIGDQALLLWLGAVIVGAIHAPGVLLPRQEEGRRGQLEALRRGCRGHRLVGAVCLRVSFYSAGLSVFMFY